MAVRQFTNLQVAHAWGSAWANRLSPAPTRDQLLAVGSWKLGAVHRELKRVEAEGGALPWATASVVAAMQDVLSRGRAPEDFLAWRGTRLATSDLNMLSGQVGRRLDILWLPATSLMEARALMALGLPGEKDTIPAVMRITVPRQTRCLYLDGYFDTGETEVLFPLGTRWRLDGIGTRSDGLLELGFTA